MRLKVAAHKAAACALLAALLLGCAAPPVRASGQIDTAHAARDRQRADACIIGAVIIYTDPFIGARLSHRQIVANIAKMCARSFAIWAEDRAPDTAAARSLLRYVIEAALRGQFRDDGGSAAQRNAR